MLSTMQLFRLLESECPDGVHASHLHMAVLAWTQLGKAAAAQDALLAHQALSADWSIMQQQLRWGQALGIASWPCIFGSWQAAAAFQTGSCTYSCKGW